MRRASIFCMTMLLGTTASFGQTTTADSQLSQALLTEIRQFRQDLQTAAATIQRVQIVMHRVQTGAALLSRAGERLDNTRARCNFAKQRQKSVANQIEQAETLHRNSKDQAEQKSAEEALPQLKASVQELVSEEQQCQVEQAEAENQFRSEQGKLNDLQDQLDKLDRILVGLSVK